MGQLSKRRRYGKVIEPPEYFRLYNSYNGENTFKFTINSDVPVSELRSMSYSTDNGVTWIKTDNVDNETVVISVTVPKYGSVKWKGDANRLSVGGTQTKVSSFSSTKEFSVTGNIMSLLYGDLCSGKLDLTGKNYCFAWLFYNCYHLKNMPDLPMTTLELCCYWSMFYSCSGLQFTSANRPTLPAKVVKPYCYYSMFMYCRNLIYPPYIEAETLDNYCFYNMFNTASLLYLPTLNATVLKQGCYLYMFKNLISRQSNMTFTLPSNTVLAQNCCLGMFSSAFSTSESTVGSFTARIGVVSLVTGCFSNMFLDCKKCKSVLAFFTDTPGTNYTNNWLSNTVSNGNFYMNSAATWNVRNWHGAPANWTLTRMQPNI